MLLENTAGQGSCLGWRFEHLAAIIGGVAEPERLGVCIDTCHTFGRRLSAGHGEGIRGDDAELDRIVGLERVKAFHLNDSKQAAGLAGRSARAHRPRANWARSHFATC